MAVQRTYSISDHSGPVFPVMSCNFVSVLYIPVFFLCPVFSCIFDQMGFSRVFVSRTVFKKNLKYTCHPCGTAIVITDKLLHSTRLHQTRSGRRADAVQYYTVSKKRVSEGWYADLVECNRLSNLSHIIFHTTP